MNAERKGPSMCRLYQLCSNLSVDVSNEFPSKFVTGNFCYGIAFIISKICPFSFTENGSESLNLVSKLGLKKADTSLIPVNQQALK